MDLKSSQLEQAFKAFFINKGGDPNARLFVWFAGHGRTENGEGFLIPADAPRPEVGRKFKFAALPMRRFGEYVRLTESKHDFAVFDSCFSGTVFEGARALPLARPAKRQGGAAPQSWSIRPRTFHRQAETRSLSWASFFSSACLCR